MMNTISNKITNVLSDRLGKHPVAEGSTQPYVHSDELMSAVTWQGPKSVAVEKVPKPTITHENDVIVKITACSICSGSDSHIFSGEINPTKKGSIMGHEGCGVIVERGPAVKNLYVGDRVVIAFDIACGQCPYCKRQEFVACDATNDSKLMDKMYGAHHCAIFGYSDMMGNVPGTQAEYVRVPFADVNCYKIPANLPDRKALYASDVLCTSLHAVDMAEINKNDTLAIWGLGPIGLLAARWAQIRGARSIIGIDSVPERLELAASKLKIHVIDRSKVKDIPAKIMEIVPGGVDAAIEASGFRFTSSFRHTVERAIGMETDSCDMITECCQAVRKYGRISVIADYIGFADRFPIGHIMMKHLTLRSGQCPCQCYFKQVFDALESGKIDPDFIVTDVVKFNDLPKAYEKLFYKKDGMVKIYCEPEKED
ncbi:glutathione-dependent formaldehyde dehydrogenase [Schizosaccharomyces japonicus yFS275]|uniref:Glutathione-dependent formaldehyde dehydrogenase n=1 Tax=Schizosaccharomyces japonicus (strain yFS275 / FY16936) TaxID=402676 RepID=B6K5T7_SCHJY|nr:glutathione-dependent formaldehyde dehydrogenase [Schizosaccharomyces japonicus yFS275]EEB08891.2 glutathione-dependent formaldehyde dehydrogenase [Schizosaccharomyces japonicus yFS275]